MEKNKIKILIVMFIVIVVLAILFTYFFSQPRLSKKVPAMPNIEESVVTETNFQNDSPVKLQEPPASLKKEADYSAEDLKMMAFSFAERLGSYSNQASYDNIKELKIFMTASMQDWADDYQIKAKADNKYSGSYEGVSTRAVTGTIKEFDAPNGKAEILVRTQRTESDSSGEKDVYRQDITLRYVFSGGEWLVDYAKWEDKS